jgi:type I restriction enzyme S subunit
MRKYPNYKPSGVEWIGDIPEHWIKTKFKYETTKPVQYGLNTNSEKYVDDGIRFLRTTDIDDFGSITDEGVMISSDEIPKGYLLQKFDFLISRSGTLGRTYLHLSDMNFSYAGYLVRFNFGCLIKSKFIFFYSKSKNFQDWIVLNTIQSTIGNVNGEKYSNLEFILPPLSEQKQIVQFLDEKTKEIDELVSMEQKKIDLLKEYRQSLISEVITGKIDVRTNLN